MPSVRAGQVSSTSIVMGRLFRPIVREEGDFIWATAIRVHVLACERPVETTGGTQLDRRRSVAGVVVAPRRRAKPAKHETESGGHMETSFREFDLPLELPPRGGQGRALPVARAGPCNFQRATDSKRSLQQAPRSRVYGYIAIGRRGRIAEGKVARSRPSRLVRCRRDAAVVPGRRRFGNGPWRAVELGRS
jgi:hypothetical protein